MSFRAEKWAYAQPLRNPTKAVLCALAFRANGKTGQCNPSLTRIAEDTGLSKTAVKAAIKTLSEARLIRVRPGDRQYTNEYTLAVDKPRGGRARGDLGGGASDGLEGRAPDDLGRQTPQGRAPDAPKQEENLKRPSQKEEGTEVEGKEGARGLRVVVGDRNPWSDGGGAA